MNPSGIALALKVREQQREEEQRKGGGGGRGGKRGDCLYTYIHTEELSYVHV